MTMHYHEKKISSIFLMFVVFPSNGFYRKAEHVAARSLNQQPVSNEISLTGCSEFYTMGCPK